MKNEDLIPPEWQAKGDFLRGLLLGILIAGILVLTVLLFRFGTVGGKTGDDSDRVLTNRDLRRKLSSVQKIINEDALEKPDPDVLESYLFRGIAVGLQDPYAAYYTQEEEEEAARANEGAYRGMGVVFTEYRLEAETEADGEETATPTFRIVVTRVYEDSPAKAASVQKGDELLTVDEQDVSGLSLNTVMEIIGDAFRAKEEVPFTFLRDGETVSMMLHEDHVPLAKVTGEYLGDGIGCIKIPEFDAVTVSQFRECLSGLQEEAGEAGLQSLILDVRDNPGGVLESVTEILDDLLDACVTLTSSNARGEQEHYEAKDGKLFGGDLAVLVNGGSASAAEVFAGALRLRGDAKIIGQTTYGKGTIQHTYVLSDGSAFKLTSEKYAIGGEEEIDGVGIVPDVEVAEPKDHGKAVAGDAGGTDDDPVLEAALEVLGGHDGE